MTKEELDAAENRIANLKSPLPPIKQPNSTQVIGGAQPLRVVGHLSGRITGHSGTLKRFMKIPVSTKGWVKMTNDEAIDYQKKGILIGHDPELMLGKLLETEGEE
jgi:hypothetical protein